LRIPALRINTRLQRLGLQPDGSVAVPNRTDVAGWYERGPRPGQAGPAVILGHVDSSTGPGVFINLGTVRRGAVVRVDRADGTTVSFRITRLARVPKTRFPTDLVYAPTLDPTLRLVTCGGSFDRAQGSYRDNVIAFADQV
jgi:sortase (surface protein transpeptidase)